MNHADCCPSCQSTQIKTTKNERRPYGWYKRLACSACGHNWTDRKQGKNCKPVPPPKQQCPECKSEKTRITESRPTEYGRRQRIECKNCKYRWTNVIGTKLSPRAQKRRDSERLSMNDIRLILISSGSSRQVGQILKVFHGVVDDVRMGRVHADKLPELPRWNKKLSKLSCLDCRFWDRDCIRPCRLGWPDPEEGGPSYANECGDYAAKP